MKDLKVRKNVRHAPTKKQQPLSKQLEQDKTITPRKRVGKLSQEKGDIAEEEYVSNKLSKKILQQARAQTEEDAEEDFEEGEDEYDEDGMEDEGEGEWEDEEEEEEEEKVVFKKPADRPKVIGKLVAVKQKPAKKTNLAAKVKMAKAAKSKAEEEEEEEDDEDEGQFKSFEELMAQSDTESVFSEFSETESQFNDEDMAVNEEDEKALAMFMNPLGPKRMLSDIIMDKLKAFEANEAAQERQKKERPTEPRKESELKPEIMQVYAKVGDILKHFTSGKLPKAFKVLPNLRNWETLLYMTRPDRWTAVVFKMATVLFSRSMSDKLVQRFYFAILLPKIREEIETNKKLSFHYYQALKKAIWRPAAFFRGIVIPLCESGDCTLREAVTIGSVLKRVSVPPVHAGVAIYKLCQIPYYGATQHLILVLLNKKFSLPYKVIDAVYVYFMKFMDDTRFFPALWHQTLLVLVMRYKGDLTAEQKSGLEKLMKRHNSVHYTAEIRRELHSVKARTDAPAMEM